MSATPPHLLLSTIDAQLARHSGYHLLAGYLPQAESVTAPRLDPPGGWPRLAAGAARRVAFTRWYLGGCAKLEWLAWRRLRRGFEGIVHFLWADRDLGFLDLLLNDRRHRLVATVHNCADQLPSVIRHPRRLRRAAAIILMSETQRAYFRAAGVADARIHFLPHGVDTDYFSPPPARDTSEFVALSVGGYRRNFTLLREVCAQLANTPRLRFEIVGPAAVAEKFHGLPNVRFFHGLDDTALLARYRGASCLLHLAEQATANNVVLEAIACGLPVVSERVGGIPEYLDSSCALLTAPGDGREVVSVLRRLGESSALQSELGTGARQRAGELAWPKIAARTLELYQSLA
ncbi:MAG: glycosyltransferase family 4 protein [Chthoniobacter sp.]|nr:glycosyltransferase family 4 protein [Chthoniobacter sp.]